jgi:toxin ParE1/3/4
MGNRQAKVSWKPGAAKSLQDIYDYIFERSPQNAESFTDELISFGETLRSFPLKYAKCRHKQFQERGYHCAVFRKNWVFLYRIIHEKVVIFNIIHAKAIT